MVAKKGYGDSPTFLAPPCLSLMDAPAMSAMPECIPEAACVAARDTLSSTHDKSRSLSPLC